MNEPERDELKDKLDDFSRRLDAEVRNWKERGEFTDTLRRLIDDIRRRRDQIEKKLELWLNQKVRLGMLLKSKRNGISAQSLMICSRSVNDWIPKKLKPDDSPADRFYIVNQFEVIRFSQRRFICSRKSYEVPITMPASAKG